MKEQLVWEGNPSQWINFKAYLGSFLFAIGIIPLILFGWEYIEPYAKYIIPIWILLPILYAVWTWIMTKHIHYELTSQRIFLKTGIFSITTNQIELYRVKDLRIEEPFWLRLVNLANIVLQTSDKSVPELVMPAIGDGRNLSNILREHIEEARDKKRVREVDYDGGGIVEE